MYLARLKLAGIFLGDFLGGLGGDLLDLCIKVVLLVGKALSSGWMMISERLRECTDRVSLPAAPSVTGPSPVALTSALASAEAASLVAMMDEDEELR